MKNLIVILFLLSSFNLFPNNCFYSSGEFSFFPNYVSKDHVVSERYELDKDSLIFFTSLTVGYQYKFVYAEAELSTFMLKEDGFLFQPYNQNYYIRAGLKYKMFSVEYEHLCKHTVDGFGINGGYDKISLKFNSKL